MRKQENNLRVTYAKAVHGKEERMRVLSVLDEERTLMGREVEEFEKRVAKFFGRKYALMVNSGSSANYLAIEILNLPPASEVITPILTFSTTVAPLVKNGLIPVFADVQPGKYVIDTDQIEKLITKKTRLLMIPLLLGNVPDMKRIKALANKHKLFLIDDSCDTFASSYNGKPTSSYSDITTTSFYGSHIMTAGGGGGMIMFDNPKWIDKVKILRGWGRSSSIFGESEDIEVRFKTKLEGIPYDAKFIFSELGYNLLPTEIGAAFGNAQLNKIPDFRKKREQNFTELYKFFKKYEDVFILPIQDKLTKTWWLAFPLTIKPEAPFKRKEFVKYLEENNIQTRPVFTGNILRQPGFKNIKYKTVRGGQYPITEEVMRGGVLIGCHHGMEKRHLDKIKVVVSSFVEKYR